MPLLYRVCEGRLRCIVQEAGQGSFHAGLAREVSASVPCPAEPAADRAQPHPSGPHSPAWILSVDNRFLRLLYPPRPQREEKPRPENHETSIPLRVPSAHSRASCPGLSVSQSAVQVVTGSQEDAAWGEAPQKVRIKREDPLLPYTTAREPLVLWDGTAALLGASGLADVAGPAVGIFR